jgi:hypothetical protein
MSLIARIANAGLKRSRADAAERWCAEHFRGRKPAAPPRGAPLVVIEAAEDLFFYNLLGTVVTGIRGLRDIRVGRWASQSFNAGASQSFKGFIAGRLNRHFLSRTRWKRLYDAPCDLAGARADDSRGLLMELSCLWRAWRLFAGLTDKDQLAALTADGILIGDLVIDTYLRFQPTVEVRLQDRYLFWVIRQALRDIAGTRAYFRRACPSLYLTTYTTYIQHGIPVRVAVAMDIPTWSFANGQEFGTRLTRFHQLQSRRCAGYAADFAQLEDQEAKLAGADALLGGRVSGIVDTATSTMRSAYQIRTQEVPDVRGAAVVFLHDFYDSPHIYHWMVFHDFWEWACVTIETLQEAGLPFFLKQHPSQSAESSLDLERLKQRYPGLRFVSPDVSNRQLVDAGMACAVTVYGSVAAEMAYMGVPSIACGDNPHASFDAFYLAHDRSEYRKLLVEFQGLPRDAENLFRQACAFYYMHNMNNTAEALELRDRMFAFYAYIVKGLLIDKAAFDPVEMAKILAGLESAAGFRGFVAGIAAELGRAAAPHPTSPEGAQQCLILPS